MDKKFSKEYRRKTWIIAIYDSDDQGSWMGKIEATKKEVKEILAAIVQSFRDRNLDFYEGGTETAENVRENWQPLEFWTPLENWPPFVNQDSLYAYANFYTSCINITAVSLENIPEFIERLKKLSSECNIDFYVSISAAKDDLSAVNTDGCTFLN